MNDNLSKLSKIILAVLIVIGVIITALFYMDLASVSDEALIPDQWVNNFLKYAYIIGIAAAVIAVGFALYSFVLRLMDNPKKAVISLLPIIVLVLVVVIAYSSASDLALDMPNYTGTDNVDGHSNLKWTGAGLYSMYALLLGALAAIIVTELTKALK